MEIQTDLCQLPCKDLEEIAKTVVYRGDDVKARNGKRLVLLIEGELAEKITGTKEEKWKY